MKTIHNKKVHVSEVRSGVAYRDCRIYAAGNVLRLLGLSRPNFERCRFINVGLDLREALPDHIWVHDCEFDGDFKSSLEETLGLTPGVEQENA